MYIGFLTYMAEVNWRCIKSFLNNQGLYIAAFSSLPYSLQCCSTASNRRQGKVRGRGGGGFDGSNTKPSGLLGVLFFLDERHRYGIHFPLTTDDGFVASKK